ncbi:MAG: energy transducer TonB [Acidobacteriota bacterium]
MIDARIGQLTLLFTGFLSVTSYCQSEFPDPKLPDCTVSRTKPNSSHSKIVSVGVINGRALRLVKPEYPPSARAVNVHGKVQISVLIDEAGCIGEAKMTSGHPLLASASLRAAKASIFEPVLLSGNPVRVYGIIIYNYLPNAMNWLELGFYSESYETLSEFLPTGFEVEAKLFRQSKESEWSEKQRVLATVRESLETDLAASPKDQWLFLLGIWLRSTSNGSWGDVAREKALSELRGRLETAPDDVSPRLIHMLKELPAITDSVALLEALRNIEVRLFDLGD